MNSILSPVFILFLVLIFGLIISKIKLYFISFDISGVLILAVLAGFILSSLFPSIFNECFSNSFTQFSKLGTALFMAVIGISSGQSMTKRSLKEGWLYIVFGVLIVLIGFISIKLISLVDIKIEKSLLMGIFCGAMTSSPGLACICEMSDINPALATAGYGATYLCGVIVVILYVQICNCKKNKIREKLHSFKEGAKEDLLYISAVVVIGYLISFLELINSLGVAGYILITGIVVGYIFKNKISKDLNTYRTLGLILFFVGNGVIAGKQLDFKIDIKWLWYGLVVTLLTVIASDIIIKKLVKTKTINRMYIISGGMTSSPAMGILLESDDSRINMSAYSLSYLGALLTITLGADYFTSLLM